MGTANCGFLQCFSIGCNGGQPGQAWDWFKNKGVVTGGDYFDIGAGDTCGPYTLAPCAHGVPATEKYPACPSSEYSTPSISECSETTYPKKYSDDKIKTTDSYSLNGIAAIQADMVQYGSATAAFTVYDDFPTYKSGVYKHTSNKQLGGHAIKLLGWELRMVRTTGWWRIPGMRSGVTMAPSRLPGATMSVALRVKCLLDVLAALKLLRENS